jgi:hypothetical protein
MCGLRCVASTWLLLASFQALANYTLALEPPTPRSTDIIRIRIDVVGLCDATHGSAQVDVSQKRILVTLSSPDTCNLDDPEDAARVRYITLGMLPPAAYTVQYTSCVFVVPPGTPCSVFRTEPLVVYGESPAPHRVPTLSWLGAMAAALGVLGGIALTRK